MISEGQAFLDPIANAYRLDGVEITDSPPSARPAVYDADARPFWGMRTTVIPVSAPEPLNRIEDLRSDFWPDEDDIDEFLKEVRRWRDEEHGEVCDFEDDLA